MEMTEQTVNSSEVNMRLGSSRDDIDEIVVNAIGKSKEYKLNKQIK